MREPKQVQVRIRGKSKQVRLDEGQVGLGRRLVCFTLESMLESGAVNEGLSAGVLSAGVRASGMVCTPPNTVLSTCLGCYHV